MSLIEFDGSIMYANMPVISVSMIVYPVHILISSRLRSESLVFAFIYDIIVKSVNSLYIMISIMDLLSVISMIIMIIRNAVRVERYLVYDIFCCFIRSFQRYNKINRRNIHIIIIEVNKFSIVFL